MRTLWRSVPNGEIQNHSFQLSLNASCKVDFRGSRVTSSRRASCKFISQDGRTTWLRYRVNFVNGNPNSNTHFRDIPPGCGYGMKLQENKLSHSKHKSKRRIGWRSNLPRESYHGSISTHWSPKIPSQLVDDSHCPASAIKTLELRGNTRSRRHQWMFGKILRQQLTFGRFHGCKDVQPRWLLF